MNPSSKAALGLALFAGLGLAAAHPAHAQVLYTQPYDGTSAGSASQVFTNLPTFTSYSFDDFTVTGAGWDITQVTAFGMDNGAPALNTAVSLAFTTAPNASSITTTYAGVESGGNLVFTQPIHLNAGNYFITSYVTRPSNGGQWYFDETTPVHGQDFYFDNPGGGFGLGTAPFHPDPGHDLAFEIDGKVSGPAAVPEPSSVASLGVGGLGLLGLMIAARRKRTALKASATL